MGVQLKKLRRMQGMSLERLASASHVSVPTLSRIEAGRRSLSLRTLQSLATGLDVPLATLVGDESHIAVTEFWPGAKSRGRSSSSNYQHGRLHLVARQIYLRRVTTQHKTFRTDGPSFVHLVRGKCTYRYGETLQELEAGDSLLIRSNIAHGIKRTLRLPIKVIVIGVWLRALLQYVYLVDAITLERLVLA